MHEYDEIDRALFALPLEEAPDGLRDAIMSVTVRAPREVLSGPAFVWWELTAIAFVLALAAWLGVGVLTNPAWSPGVSAAFRGLTGAFANASFLGWLVVGASIAFWLSIVNLQPQRAGVRSSTA